MSAWSETEAAKPPELERPIAGCHLWRTALAQLTIDSPGYRYAG